MLNAVLYEETGELMENRHLMKKLKYREVWGTSYGNKLAQLAQLMSGQVEGTNTIIFINKEYILTDCWRDVMYERVLINYRPEKRDPNRTRLTVWGNRLNWPGYWGTPTVDLLTVRLLLNSVIYTPGSRYMTLDIRDFYLNTPMKLTE